jgi:hypothetical protein
MLGHSRAMRNGFDDVRSDLTILIAATMRIDAMLEKALYLLREDPDGDEERDDA